MSLSIAIPAYNRPSELRVTLESIADQCAGDVEILVCEDRSPRADEIQDVVANFKKQHPKINIRYNSNSENLGYDGNLRRLVELALGDFIFFLGDDDVVPAGSIERVLKAIETPNVGVLLRAWRAFDTNTGEILHEHRYFSGDRVFEPGEAAIAAFFRRSVFISGLVVQRAAARDLSTDRYDGTLLYQLYLVGNILKSKRGYYIDEFLADRRCGGEHFFGSSKRERGYDAGKTEVQHSERFIAGLLRIADALDDGEMKVSKRIRKDVASYSYPLLETQATRIERWAFIQYGLTLARFGLGQYPLFWVYLIGLTCLGPHICNSGIRAVYGALGRTPVLTGEVGTKVVPVRVGAEP